MNSKNNICLAVETAVSGGSIALFAEQQMVAHFSGSESTSRAEGLLSSIDKLLGSNKIPKSSLSRIAVSVGPGSYTGLRIGIATVLGLGKALGIEATGIPLFTAIDLSENVGQAYVLAVPMGRNDICFEVKGSVSEGSGLRVGSLEDLSSTFMLERLRWILVHSDLVESVSQSIPNNVEILDLGRNMAEYVGRASTNSRLVTTTLSPIYVQNPRFG